MLTNKTLKMSVIDLIMIVLLTHVIAHSLKKVDMIEFIKANLRLLKEEP